MGAVEIPTVRGDHEVNRLRRDDHILTLPIEAVIDLLNIASKAGAEVSRHRITRVPENANIYVERNDDGGQTLIIIWSNDVPMESP